MNKLLIVIVFSVFFTMLIVPSYALTFPNIINLSDAPNLSDDPHIAVDGDKVYTVWRDRTLGNDEIFFKRSLDGGNTFGSIINLSNTLGFQENSGWPHVSFSGNNVYVVWQENVVFNQEIFFIKSSDNGATFGSKMNISNTPENSLLPQLASEGNNIYVVWREGRHAETLERIFFSRSIDSGISFGSPAQISTNTQPTTFPAVASYGNNVYVVWITGFDPLDVFFIKSMDNGISFGTQINLTNSGTAGGIPDIKASGNDVFVVYQDQSEIFFKKSNDSGNSFTSSINLSNNAGSSSVPRVNVLDPRVFVVWMDNTLGSGFVIFGAASGNGGITFGDAQMSDSSVEQRDVEISTANDKIHFVWNNFINDQDVFYSSTPFLNSPPECLGSSPSVGTISKSNQKLVDVSINGVTDIDGDAVSVTITGITQDESTNGLTRKDRSPDGFGVGTDTAQVRAERDSQGNGRVYEILFEADDGNGGTCTDSVNVVVPKNKKTEAVDDGQNFDSTIP